MSTEQGGPGRSSFFFGAFHLCAESRSLLRDGNPVKVSQRAIDILLALVERSGRVVDKVEIFDRAWPGETVPESDLRVQVRALRRALGTADDGKPYILNIAGRGYSFVGPVSGSPLTLDGCPSDDGSDLSAKFLAHDINNVLQIIGGNLDLLDQALPSDHEARRYLRSAIKGVALGTSLASTALSHPGASRAEDRPLEENLTDFGDLIAAAAGPDISLRLSIGSALPPMRGDVNDLKNMVLNLVVNAREAMHGLGELDVSFINCPTGDNVIVKVRDNGPGIAPEFVPRVFDPNFSTKMCVRQHGLGLASVRSFAEKAGAKIAVDSGPHGTTVALRIPALVATIDGGKP